MTKHLMMSTAAAALALGLAGASASAETLSEALQKASADFPKDAYKTPKTAKAVKTAKADAAAEG